MLILLWRYFVKYRIDIVSKLKSWYRVITSSNRSVVCHSNDWHKFMQMMDIKNPRRKSPDRSVCKGRGFTNSESRNPASRL